MPPTVIQALQTALLGAFSLSKFDNLLQLRLNKKREHFSLASNLPDIIADVLQAAERMGWLDELVAAAAAENPSNQQLALVAEKYVEIHQTQERIAQLESRVLLSQMGGDVSAEMIALGNLGVAQIQSKQRDTGVQNLRRAVDLSRQMQHVKYETTWLNALGFYLINDEPFEAVQLLQQAAALAAADQDLPMLLVINGNLGQCFASAALLDKAATHYQTCLQLAEQLNDTVAQGRALYNLSTVYYRQNKAAMARSHAQQALLILEAANVPLAESARDLLAHIPTSE